MRSASPVIQVLMASHNRREKTLLSIESLYAAAQKENLHIRVTLADSSSTDGTPEAVTSRFPEVHVLHVSRDSFWAKSMRQAWLESQHNQFDYLMWLNDDVVLLPDAFRTLLEACMDASDLRVIVGSTFDPFTGARTYGGMRRGPWWNFLRLEDVTPEKTRQEINLANGNIILIPRPILKNLDGFPDGFNHSMADLFFSSQVSRIGHKLVLAAGYQGHCATNPIQGTWRDSSLPRSERFRLLKSPKGLPFLEWARLCFGLGGPVGLRYLFSPIARILVGR